MDTFLSSSNRSSLSRVKELRAEAEQSQTLAFHILHSLVEELSAAKHALLVENAVLKSEVSFLNKLVKKMDSESQALQISAVDKINSLLRRLHPGGSWKWVWDGRRAETAESDFEEDNDDELRDLSESQLEDMVLKMSTVDDETQDLVRELLAGARPGLFGGISLRTHIAQLPRDTVIKLYEIVVLGKRDPRLGDSGDDEDDEEDSFEEEAGSELEDPVVWKEEDRNGWWTWSSKEDHESTPAEVVVASKRSFPPPSLKSLPVELVDMIISFIPSKDHLSLCRTDFSFLRRVCGPLYNAPTMNETEGVRFVAARIHAIPSKNRIRPLLTPSILQLRALGDHTQPLPYLIFALHGLYDLSKSISVHLPLLNVVAEEGTARQHLSFWSRLLCLFNPVVFQLTVGSTESQRRPPTISRISRDLLSSISSTWTRLEEVAGLGEGSVLLLEGGDALGDRLAFRYTLGRISQVAGRGSVLYYRLETRVSGQDEPSLVEWVPRTTFVTRLALPPTSLRRDEVSCRFVVRG